MQTSGSIFRDLRNHEILKRELIPTPLIVLRRQNVIYIYIDVLIVSEFINSYAHRKWKIVGKQFKTSRIFAIVLSLNRLLKT